MKKWIVVLALLAPLFGFSEWITDFETAKKQATAEGKPILLYFSGSDWCAPCIKLKKEIFQSEAFSAYAKENLVLLMADFPRRKANRPSPEQQVHNDALAEKYNRTGAFPFTALLDANGKKLTSWSGFPDLTVEQFIAAIKKHTPADNSSSMQLYKKELLLMGSRFEITVVADNAEKGHQEIGAAIAEIQRIEDKISSWKDDSETAEINKNAGKKPVKVSKETFDLIARSKRVSELTQGAFDISFGSVDDQLWHFDGSMTELPDSATARQSVRRINHQNVVLDEQAQTVFLKEAGMKIGFGAIGKGYAAERAKALLLADGIENGIVNAGGDLTAWGAQPGGAPWNVGIANPGLEDEAFSWLNINDNAVVTSGNYKKFVVIDGKKYTHIIDPRTGFPVSGLKSVTIICPNAELADALATSVFIMGKEVGLNLIDQMKGVECLLIDDNNQLHTSNNIALNDNQ